MSDTLYKFYPIAEVDLDKLENDIIYNIKDLLSYPGLQTGFVIKNRIFDDRIFDVSEILLPF